MTSPLTEQSDESPTWFSRQAQPALVAGMGGKRTLSVAWAVCQQRVPNVPKKTNVRAAHLKHLRQGLLQRGDHLVGRVRTQNASALRVLELPPGVLNGLAGHGPTCPGLPRQSASQSD